MVTNPATQPAEAVDGDNLTVLQASYLLAFLQDDPDDALSVAEKYLAEQGQTADAESFLDDLVTFLSDAAGEEDDDEAAEEEDEADPSEMEAQ